jgi:tetratricopeptide (TPR) repeat protein
LQASLKNIRKPHAVYPILAANQDKLNDDFVKWFHKWTMTTMSKVNQRQAEKIAISIRLFSEIIQQFPLGDRAINLEIAIIGYELASDFFIHQKGLWGKLLWAETQCNLSLAYSNRIRKDKAENLERAILACQEALQIIKRESLPAEWAAIQNNLGKAYCDRIYGEKADNLEQAIHLFNAALQINTPKAFPSEWAKLQHNLGNAYL